MVSVWAFLLGYTDSVGVPRLALCKSARLSVKAFSRDVQSTSEVLDLIKNVPSRLSRLPNEERPLTYKRSVAQVKLELMERVLATFSQIQAFNGMR